MIIDNISVVIIASNADETIFECLNNLNDFVEVILYLNNSTDNTRTIAEKFNNVKIIEGTFTGFGDTRNKATSFATKDWILSLDSDEILNLKIIKEISTQTFIDENVVYTIKLDNYFLGAKTVSVDYKDRLYNKKYIKYDDSLVHEKIITNEKTKKILLEESIKHLNITNINQTLTKMIKYTDLGSKDKKMCFFSLVIAKTIFAFIQAYFLRFYILDGWRGFVIATTSANRRYYKYLKQFINCQDIK